MFVVASDNQQTSFPDLTVQVSEWDVKPYYTIPYHTIPYHTTPYHSWLSRSTSGALNPTLPHHTIPDFFDCPGQWEDCLGGDGDDQKEMDGAELLIPIPGSRGRLRIKMA